MTDITLHPIKNELLSERDHRFSLEVSTVYAKTVEWYKTIGFDPPWIGYLAEAAGEIVGSCAFKGRPLNGRIEIAYQTLEPHRNKGFGSAMCMALCEKAINHDSSVEVTARTLTEPGHSTRILERNGFRNVGEIIDHDGTPVWEWVLTNERS